MSLALATPLQIRTVTTFDDSWYRAVTSFAQHTAWLQQPMKIYTVGGVVLLALMALYAWWVERSRGTPASMAAVAWLGFGTLISVGAGLVLKIVFAENRPCQAIHVRTVEACPSPSDYSFPSDHATVAVALALGLWLVNRKLGIIGLALAALEGFDRVYTGQHYPHDVLAGALLSGIVLLLGWPQARRSLTSLIEALERTRMRPLLTAAKLPERTANNSSM